MAPIDPGSTSPSLLLEVANWNDHAAWCRLRGRYDPILRVWCGRYGLDADEVDEVCQEIWIEIADRIRTFHYNPAGSFRGWLRRLCGFRVVDLLRGNRRDVSLGDRADDAIDRAPPGAADGLAGEDVCPECDLVPRDFRGGVEQIQSAVRTRVKLQNWEAFWLVAVCDWSVERTAESLGMTRAAVYAARGRVGRMLRDEARARWADGRPSRDDRGR